MQLTFESLAELQDFVQWVQAARQVAPVMSATAKVVSGAPNIVVKDLPAGDGEAADDPAPVEHDQHDAPADKPARKRRTKAEMEAARAAETESGETSAATVAAEQLATSGTTSAAVAESASIPAADSAPVDKGDAVEFIKARLAERPEVSQVEHLNLARTFIGKHGMEKYNASFPLAGLTPNVMGYSPADCATHAAALDFLSLE